MLAGLLNTSEFDRSRRHAIRLRLGRRGRSESPSIITSGNGPHSGAAAVLEAPEPAGGASIPPGSDLDRRRAQMETNEASSSTQRWAARLRRLRLRFEDPFLEARFRADQFRHNLGNIRFAFIAGIALWVSWGLLLNPQMLALSDQRIDR